MSIALIAAFFGFTGIVEYTAVIAQTVFYASVVFTFLSLLFCLFEGAPENLNSRPLTLSQDDQR